jgi:hypothetical protein
MKMAMGANIQVTLVLGKEDQYILRFTIHLHCNGRLHRLPKACHLPISMKKASAPKMGLGLGLSAVVHQPSTVSAASPAAMDHRNSGFE